MKHSDLVDAIDQISRGRNIDKKTLIDAIEGALASASKKYFGANLNIRVHLNEQSGDIEAVINKRVVEGATLNKGEISLGDALKFAPEAKVGDEVDQVMPLEELGRISAQTAKQVVMQKVREAERENVFEEYKAREGELVNGTVRRRESDRVLMDLGETEAVIPYREMVFRESYRPGDRLRAYVISVKKTSKGAQVVVSRTHPELVKKLFELEVPEIGAETVLIKGLAREPGLRTKIAVASTDPHVDAVGACVGVKGSRVQSVVQELQGEKIDIVEWSEDPKAFIANALSPAKITEITIDRERGSAVIIVPDDQLSLAIGKKGQNARLGSKLTGYEIDIFRESERDKAGKDGMTEEKILLGLDMGARTALKLVEAGYNTAELLAAATVEDLAKIEGISEKTAERVIRQAREKQKNAPVEDAGRSAEGADEAVPVDAPPEEGIEPSMQDPLPAGETGSSLEAAPEPAEEDEPK